MNRLKTLLGITVVALLFSACNDELVEGIGPEVTRELTLHSFEKVSLEEAANVYISQGIEQRVIVTGQPNIINRLNTTVYNNEWRIDLEDANYRYQKLEVNIIVPDIRKVELAGSGSIFLEDFETVHNQEFILSGSGLISVGNMEGPSRMDLKITGSGNIKMRNAYSEVDLLNARITGSGSIEAFNVPAKRCTIRLEGSGNCEVWAEEELSVRIDASGTVYYIGHPSISMEINGSGRVIDAN